MSAAIYKYTVKEPVQTIEMPLGASIVTTETQDGNPTFWAWVDTNQKETVKRKFCAIPTGVPFNPSSVDYIGTCHDVAYQGLVFHLFEITGPVEPLGPGS